MTAAEKEVVRWALAWFRQDRPPKWPSGLRILTTGDVWEPSPSQKKLAKACSNLLTERRK
jgi:hypothetical protein